MESEERQPVAYGLEDTETGQMIDGFFPASEKEKAQKVADFADCKLVPLYR